MAKKPLQSVPVVDPKTGLIDRSWDLYLREQDQERASTAQGLADLSLPNGQQPWAMPLLFQYPDAVDYDFLDMPYGITILEVAVKTRVGTATVTVAGDGTLSGGPGSATTTQSVVTHATGNTVAAGNKIRITITALSSDCEGLSVTLKGSYALA